VKISGDKLKLDTLYNICIFRAAYVLNMTLPEQLYYLVWLVTLTTAGAESDVHIPKSINRSFLLTSFRQVAYHLFSTAVITDGSH
jgi:hypothetical protein